MTKPLLYGLALLLCLPSFECGYLVLAPKSFRAGEDYKVSVGVEGMNNIVQLTGELKSIKPQTNTRITATGNVNNGDTTLLNFQVGGSDIRKDECICILYFSICMLVVGGSDIIQDECICILYISICMLVVGASVDDGMYNLTISGTDGGNSFVNTTTVERVRNDVLVLIQTDKAIYKPNQVIKIRTFAIDSNYNVVKRPITISIMDKNQNKLAEFKNKQSASGVIGVEFPLSDEPPLGDWSVQASTEGGSEMKTVKIDEYVLPKFEVNTEITPGYVLYGKQNQVTVKISAKYTYGKDVNAMAKVLLKGDSMTSEKTVNFKGSVDVPFTVEEMLGSDMVNDLMFGRYYWTEKNIDVTVNVTDVTSRFSILDDSSVKFYSYPQKIHLEPMNSMNIYHPGLPVKFRVKVTDPVGEPLSEYGMTVKVSQGYSGKNVQYVTINSAQWYEVSFTTEDQDASSNLYIQAEINGTDKKVANQASVSLNAYSTEGKTVIQLTNLDGFTTEKLDLDKDQNIDVKVKATGSLSLMSYVVLSKGKITAKGSLDFSSNLEQTIRLTVTSDMSPMANLLVYGVTNGKVKEVIVDVYEIMIDNGMKNKVSAQFSAPELRANSKVDLTVNSDPQSDVFVLAVDKSVMLLATGNDITKESLMDNFKMFTGEKKENDRPGFGEIMFRKKRSIIGGYGQTNADQILKASELLYLTNFDMKKNTFDVFPILQRAECANCGMAFAAAPDAGVGFMADVDFNIGPSFHNCS
ncbi:hypothetical protein LOTGIDRAFT_229818 [Lottia gigantea]|uniref:Alpha-2-macroglobulin bait region domain-containing protein n=1 Tax=Lottia gigantea TaxID=225164 RepID=V3ZPL7_LOTGI|nr:hypothetical protein LOTGIDRAFT_229818 [Lottia gigantea]ESO82801.1 hypothetical protein LOTGIDRAFT_229818 [Lottia gigantea]